MKNIITTTDEMIGHYKNIGKNIWVYSGLYSGNKLTIKKEKLTVLCETEGEYCTISEFDKQEIIPVAKTMEFDYCCPYVVNNTHATMGYNGVECRTCLMEDNESKAKSLMAEEIKNFAKKRNIDCNGL